MDSKNEVILGYWGVRGRGGLLRSLLTYCEVPYKDKIYTTPTDWFAKDKQELGFEYPNLPYLIDGDKKVTESASLELYIPIKAGKRELIGDTDEKFVKVQQARGAVLDLKTDAGKLLSMQGDFQTNKEEAFNNGSVKTRLEFFNKKLEGQEWLTGFLSIADFNLFETIDFIHDHEESKLAIYPNLVAFRKRFLEIPQIKAYVESDRNLSVWFPGVNKWKAAVSGQK